MCVYVIGIRSILKKKNKRKKREKNSTVHSSQRDEGKRRIRKGTWIGKL